MTVISDSIVKECGMALIENEDLKVGNSTNQYFNSDKEREIDTNYRNSFCLLRG